ncbi:TIGR02186 family protein, partial [Mesorhizobium sp. M4B.F.Ca.ET.143.01.1.1]
MAGMRAFAAAIPLSMLFAISPATAQTPPTESIQIGLSTDAISITAGFSGADLT